MNGAPEFCTKSGKLLEALARLRFEPQAGNELGLLVSAQGQDRAWLQRNLQPLLSKGAALQAEVRRSRGAEVQGSEGEVEPLVQTLRGMPAGGHAKTTVPQLD